MSRQGLQAWTRLGCGIVACLSAALYVDVAVAADTLPAIDVRFRPADVAEKPDFRRHVVPLLGKLGCNGRACHGSFQGQGGFQLSLFGYDFKLDHEQITGGEKPRVDKEDPEGSLLLSKPTLMMPHKGGRRLDVDSWQQRVLVNWISQGAAPVIENDRRTVRLEVTPTEIPLSQKGETVKLSVKAVWSDGVVEDVLPLCRFQTNDEHVVTISDSAVVTAGEPGDTHVVVFYDNCVVPIPVTRPLSPLTGDKYPDVPTPTRIDELVVQKWKKLGLVPSAVSDDAEFLRRVSLDMTGTLPAPQEIEAFLSDSSSDKRSRKIDELLERPAYAAWWAIRLCDMTGNNQTQLNNISGLSADRVSQDWYDWLRLRVEQNMAYDKLVEGIVLATSRKPGTSYEEYTREMSEHYRPGAATTYADEEDLTWYWSRKNFRQPDERALGFAYSFLGIRIQCAQCHKHPFDQWTQDDFQQFTGFFKGLGVGPVNPQSRKEYLALLEDLKIDPKAKGNDLRKEISQLLKDGKRVPFDEVYTVAVKGMPAKQKGKKDDKDKKNPKPQAVATARVLGGEQVDLTKHADAREPLMAWLRDRNNPYFARAFVNRVWSNYFSVGIVQPVDDLSLANPPSNRPLLDYLTAGFIDSGYNMKWLHRQIANSRVYQLTWKPNETNANDLRNFSRSIPRRMAAEVAYDAVLMATASDATLAQLEVDLSRRAISQPGTATSRNQNAKNIAPTNYVLTVFGKSMRESNCECDRSSEASLLQKVWLANDGEMFAMIDRADGFVRQMLTASKQPQPEAKPQPAAPAVEEMKKRKKKKAKEAEAAASAEAAAGKEGSVEKQAPATTEAAAAKPADEKSSGEKSTGETPAEKKPESAQPSAPQSSAADVKPAEKGADEKGAGQKGKGKGTDDPLNYENLISLAEKRVAKLKDKGNPERLKQAEQQLAKLKKMKDARDAKQAAPAAVETPKPADAASLIKSAYLRTLSRYPTPEEMRTAESFLKESAQPVEGVRGLVWALLNTKEFIVNH